MFRIFLCPKTSVKLLLEQNKWSLEQKKLSFPIFIYSITIHKLSCSRKLAQAKYMDKKKCIFNRKQIFYSSRYWIALSALSLGEIQGRVLVNLNIWRKAKKMRKLALFHFPFRMAGRQRFKWKWVESFDAWVRI